MASKKALEAKKGIVSEIISKFDSSESVIWFRYSQSSVADLQSLRRKLKESGSELKVYKNTLVKLAMDDKKINVDEFLEGQNAIVFGKDLISSIKAISDFSKEHDNIKILTGVVNGEVVSLDTISEYASIPSMEGLLTMFAGGLIEHVKNLSIALNLYAEQLGEEK